MRMLDNLKEVLDDIEATNDWEHRFVQDLLIKLEENPDHRLSGKQFRKLTDIHRRYCE